MYQVSNIALVDTKMTAEQNNDKVIKPDNPTLIGS